MKKTVLIFSLLTVFITLRGQTPGDFTDPRDGRVYKIILVGEQWWFAENLSFRGITGYLCYDTLAANCEKYGCIYTFESAMNACPRGWHLPGDDEWTMAEIKFGLDPNEAREQGFRGANTKPGDKFKSKTDWKKSSYSQGNNVSGFSILPGGYYNHKPGEFKGMGEQTEFWTATPNGGGAWFRSFSYLQGTIYRNTDAKADGKYVRCVKD